MGHQHMIYRVESNYGCKYFESEERAKSYFFCRVDADADVELWCVIYTYGKAGLKHAEQHLMAYAGDNLVKA